MCVKKAMEVLNAIKLADPGCAFGYSTVARWTQQFNNGRSETSYQVSVTDGLNMGKVKNLFKLQ